MSDLKKRLEEERDRHVAGYPGPRRDVAELLDDALSALSSLSARVGELETALVWYENNAAGCRLIHSGGDAHRHALAADGGNRARSALAKGGNGNG